MGMSTTRYNKVCTDYRKLAYWPTNYSIKNDYFEVPHTPSLFRHKTRPVWFTLVVDDFRIKYVGNAHAQHLLGVLKEFYKIEEDWMSSLYYGITLD